MVQGWFYRILLNFRRSISSYQNIFQIDIIRSKGNNQCYVKGWWQNELVFYQNISCKSNDSNMELYLAWNYPRVLDGQVRNFSYIKK